ncbi:putative squamosa promoter-binding-like protein [Helianthus annuus]|nr:putative squamosa promoter-binding-like protein [Helianthus annuus]
MSFQNNGNSGGFVMEFSSCSRGKVHWPNTRAPPTATTKLPPPYINPNVPPGPGGCFNGVQDSNCALSLLSNHSSASRNQALTHENYVNPHADAGSGAHMVQPPTETMVQGQGHFSTGWAYDTDESHLGLGQISQSSGFYMVVMHLFC